MANCNDNEDDDDNCIDNVINTKRMKLSSSKYENSFIDNLNDDCFMEIFSYLSITDIIHVEKVCKRWKGLCQESWKQVESLECIGNTCSLMGKCYDHKLYQVKCLDDLKRILKSCGRFIKYFHLSCGCLTNQPIFMTSLLTVPKLCNNLQDVNIDLFNSPSIIEIQSMINNCKNLEKLVITRIDQEYEEELSELLRNNKALKYFALGSDCCSNNMSGEFLESLSSNVIEEIHLKRCEISKPKFFISAIRKFDYLQSFTYGPNGYFDDSMVDAIGGRGRSLKKLSMTCISYKSSKSMNHLGNLINLEELILSCNYQLQDDTLINISNNCKQLKLLEISFCHSITNKGIASVSKLSKLEVLKMDGLFQVTDDPIGNLPDTLKILICSICERVKDRGVRKLIRRAPNLTQLNLYLCSVTNSTIRTAIRVTKKRINGIVLRMNIDETNANLAEITEMSPYLQIFK